MATATLNPPCVKVSTGTSSLPSQEQKDMEKFSKFLAQKMVQIIVQARLGERIITPCKPLPSTTDWFNLEIEDIPEVLAETKKILKGKHLSLGCPPLCVEISLRTAEGDSMILENWSLAVSENTESLNRVTYTVYSRMSLLLKSIISVSRITPAYRLSGRQGADSFVLCYRICMGEPHDLGLSAASCTIGQVETPIGIYTAVLTYRTQLTLSPKDGAMLVKSDHFTPDFSPRLCRATDRRKERTGESSSGSEPVASDESQEACRLFVNSPPGNKIPDNQTQNQKFSFEDGPKFGAFADPPSARRNLASEFTLPELPLPTFMRFQASKPTSKDHSEEPPLEESSKETEIAEETIRSTNSLGPLSSGEDFVMVESLKTPFAEIDSSQDVGAFFRECQSAPVSLQSFNRASVLGTQEIGSQLEQFEKDLQFYDDLVQSLCIDSDDSGKV